MNTASSLPMRVLPLVAALLVAHGVGYLEAAAPGAGRVQMLVDLRGISGPVNGVAFSPDEKHVAACGGKEVRIWDLETGELHYTLRGQIGDGSYGDCLAVAFSPDNCFLLVGISNQTEMGSIRVYDTHDLTEIRELLPGHRLPVTRLAFSHDSRYLATADTSGMISIFDWPLRRVIATVTPGDHAGGQYNAFGFPTLEPFLVARGKETSAVITVPAGKILPNQKYVPTSLVRWLEMQSSANLPGSAAAGVDLRLDQKTWIAASTDKSGTSESHWVACWNPAIARPRSTYRGHQRTITSLALSQSCRLAASGDQGGTVHVWETATAQPRFVLRNVGQPCYRAGLDMQSRTLGFAPSPLRGAQWKHNSFGQIDRVFDLRRRAVVGVPNGAIFPAEATDFSGTRLSLTYIGQRYGLQLSSAAGVTAALDLGQEPAPTCFALLRHGQLGVAQPIVVGDNRGGLVCYNPATRQPCRHFVGHSALITSLSESPDGRLMTTSSTDGTIRVWSLGGRPTTADVVEPLLSLLMTARQEWILWTPEGYYEASPGAGDLVGLHVNRGPERSAQFLPLHQFRRQLYRPDIIDGLLEAASLPDAIAAANALVPNAPPPVDLRQAETIGKRSPPEVRIINPLPGTVTKERQVDVVAEIVSQDDHPITDMRLLVNGRPGGQKGLMIVGGEGEKKSRLSISQSVLLLPGENTISVLASNALATSVPVIVTITYEAPEEEQNRRPKLHLLSIGVSEYAIERLNLRYAHLDAREFAHSWETQRGRLYSEVATTLLVNQEASADRIRIAMKELLAAVDRRDVVVIFLSAHGVRDAQLEYYLGTHEVDPKDLPATGVHFREVTELLEQLPGKVLMFVDTCHSAGITGAKSIAADPLYELTSDEYGTIVFASSLSREVSLENEAWGHGAFTKAILETFADKASDLNADGYLSLTELEQRVYDQVQKLTDGLQHPVMSRPATVPNIRFYQLAQAEPTATQSQ